MTALLNIEKVTGGRLEVEVAIWHAKLKADLSKVYIESLILEALCCLIRNYIFNFRRFAPLKTYLDIAEVLTLAIVGSE